MLLWFVLFLSHQIQYRNFYFMSSYYLLPTVLGFSSLLGSSNLIYDAHQVAGGHQPKRSQYFWVQTPESYPTKILFAKDTLPDGTISHQ
jgi:hypothetical protein